MIYYHLHFVAAAFGNIAAALAVAWTPLLVAVPIFKKCEEISENTIINPRTIMQI